MIKKFIQAAFVGFALAATTSCRINPLTGQSELSIANCGQIFYTFNTSRQQVGVAERVQVSLLVNNPCNHNLDFRFAADRGQVVSLSSASPAAEYIAPFSGGTDTIRVSVFDQNDGINLPQQQFPILILGDGLAYVEAPPPGTTFGESDNGVIKVVGVQGAGGLGGQPRQVAVGRQPTISPDGRYLAYTYYPGDGTSQIRVQDTAGNVTILSGNSRSFNLDPAWAPIGNDRLLNLVFSSDRLNSREGEGLSERGEAYNIWRADVLGQNIRQLSSTPGSEREPVWSPDGRVIIYRSNFSQNQVQNFENLWRLSLQDGRLLQLTYETAPNMGAYEPAFSPDGGRIVYSRKYISRQTQALYDFQKIWLLNLSQIDIPSLTAFLPNQPTTPGSTGPVPDPVLNPTLPGSVSSLNGNFGNIATQEFDEGTVETSPSFSVDGRWITYVRTQGDDIRTLSIPGNPGNLGTVGFEPMNVLPQGSERAIEVDWARQPQAFGRF